MTVMTLPALVALVPGAALAMAPLALAPEKQDPTADRAKQCIERASCAGHTCAWARAQLGCSQGCLTDAAVTPPKAWHRQKG